MALQKNIDYKGINLEYIKILSFKVEVDYLNNDYSTIIEVGVYKDEAARTSDINNFMYITTIRFDGVFTDRVSIYTKLKTEQYYGAIDV